MSKAIIKPKGMIKFRSQSEIIKERQRKREQRIAQYQKRVKALMDDPKRHMRHIEP